MSAGITLRGLFGKERQTNKGVETMLDKTALTLTIIGALNWGFNRYLPV